MIMPRRYQEVEVLLNKLAESLRVAHLWADVSPSKKALASDMPFAYDTMPLENWLQFIFIPNMHGLIESGLPLPDKLELLPIAELNFAGLANKQKLLVSIEQIDECFNE